MAIERDIQEQEACRESLTQWANELADKLAASGNTKDMVFWALREAVQILQGLVDSLMPAAPPGTPHAVSAQILVIASLIDVLENNPLYESDALTLQLKNSIRRYMSTCDWRPLKPATVN